MAVVKLRRPPTAAEREAPRGLRDVVAVRPRLLLVGINPGLRSGMLGHHFAGAGNPFWRLLHAAGLTPRLLTFAEDRSLAELGIALTNLCPRTTRTAAELTSAELAQGRDVLTRKIARWRPTVVAFVGVSLYRTFFRVAGGPGPGAKKETISGARVFVVPNPSGLNASFPGFAEKLRWFRALRRFVDRQAPGPTIPAPARRPRTRLLRFGGRAANPRGHAADPHDLPPLARQPGR